MRLLRLPSSDGKGLVLGGFMRLAFVAAIALAVSGQASAFDASSAEEIATAFNTLCVEPFGDAAKVEAAANAAGLKKPETKTGLVVANGWQSETVDLMYSDSAWMPRDLPSPQCAIMVRAPAEADHNAIVAAVQAKLGLSEPKTKGKKGRFESEWNLTPAGKDKRRIFVKSELNASGVAIRLSLLNLRG